MQPSPSPADASFPPPGWLTRKQAAARLGTKPGEGFVTHKQALAMFNVVASTWHMWTLEGKVPQPRRLPKGATGRGPRLLYALADLERMRDVVHDPNKPHVKPDGSLHVPPGFVRRQAACAMFGVGKTVWERWEKEGVITCGVYVRPWPKLYPLAEIKRLLLECGRLTPPYPDPQHPGCYRVPLADAASAGGKRSLMPTCCR
jgi:hypothetical protein